MPPQNLLRAVPILPAHLPSVPASGYCPTAGGSSYLIPPAGFVGRISYMDIPGPNLALVKSGISASSDLFHPKYAALDSSQYLQGDTLGDVKWFRLRRFFSGLYNLLIKDPSNGGTKKVHPLSADQMSYLLRNSNRFGIVWDGRGNHFYDPSKLDEIKRFLGDGRYIQCDWGILKVALDGDPDPVFIFPSDEKPFSSRGSSSKFELELSSFRAPKFAADVPIIFYLEGMAPTFKAGARNSKPGAASWAVSMRELGYEITFVNSVRNLSDAIKSAGAKIVLASAAEEQMPYAVQAYHIAKSVDPNIIVGLGGAGAIPEAAGLFDVVGVGEHYIGLPKLLEKLVEISAAGEIKEGRKTPLKDLINAAESDQESKDGAMAVFGDAMAYSPLFSVESAAKVFSASASRVFYSAGGENLELSFPVFHDPFNGAGLFIKSDSGILAPLVRDAAASYARARDEWEIDRSLGLFPLRENEFVQASRPILYSEREFDSLAGARYPSNRDADTGALFSIPSIYAQHGCKTDPAHSRCSFCSIKYPAGKRAPSIDQIIRVMQRSVLAGHQMFIFNDDRFVQSKSWVNNLIEAVTSLGIEKRLRIAIQTRADGISDDLIKSLRDKLGALFGIGVETLSWKRAENQGGLGKVAVGRGEAYVRHAKETIERLAKSAKKGDSFYIICASPGDSILDIAEDVYNQLLLMVEMWDRYRYAVPFKYNFQQLPFYGDRITPEMSGYLRAQPGAISLWGSRRIWTRDVEGEFLPFGPDLIDGSFAISGIFLPKDFKWPKNVERFISYISGADTISLMNSDKKTEISIGDLIEGLKHVSDQMDENSGAANESEALSLWLSKIESLYLRAHPSLVPHLENRYQRSKRAYDKKIKRGGSPNAIS